MNENISEKIVQQWIFFSYFIDYTYNGWYSNMHSIKINIEMDQLVKQI